MNLDGANDEINEDEKTFYGDEKEGEEHFQNILDSANPLSDLLQSNVDERQKTVS